MQIKLKSLKLICKKSEELIEFGSRISFFHGQMSSGKSTVVELVNFCFGGKRIKTPAISSEGIKVQLALETPEKLLLIERSFGSESVDVSWRQGEDLFSEKLPISAGSDPVIGDSIFNLSDFLLSMLGITPIKVRESKQKESSPLRRLSFREFYRFCYLDQPHLDSSFFRLETPVLNEKSKDVLKYIFGFQSDRLTILTQELQELRQRQRSLREAATQIKEFLESYGFASETDIDTKIHAVDKELDHLESEKDSQVHGGMLKMVSDDLRNRADNLNNRYYEKQEAISDIRLRIEEQKSLRAELISLKLKAARAVNATALLSGAKFDACPCCGREVASTTDPDHCSLCKAELSSTPSPEISPSVLEQDLADRIEDLRISLRRLESSLLAQEASVNTIAEERAEAENEIAEVRSSVESEYLKRARKIESEIGKYSERRRFLLKVRKMPSAIEQRQKKADALSSDISEKQRQIEAEEKKFNEGRTNVQALEKNFLDILIAIRFPEISDKDKIQVNTRSWMPFIHPSKPDSEPWTFEDAGSGGKTVLFKICYALAIHKTAAEKDLFIPRWFIVDSTMKNITPDINREVFEAFYQELYRLLNDELADWQCIVVDQTFSPFAGFNNGTYARKMVVGDPDNPPLISYYPEV